MQPHAMFVNGPARRNDITTTPRVMELLLPGSATVRTVHTCNIWLCLGRPAHRHMHSTASSPLSLCPPKHPLVDEFTNFVNFDISPSPHPQLSYCQPGFPNLYVSTSCLPVVRLLQLMGIATLIHICIGTDLVTYGTNRKVK